MMSPPVSVGAAFDDLGRPVWPEISHRMFTNFGGSGMGRPRSKSKRVPLKFMGSVALVILIVR